MIDYQKLLRLALDEAYTGLKEGGVPVGGVLADAKEIFSVVGTI